MRTIPIALLILAGLLWSTPTAVPTGQASDTRMVILKIKHVGAEDRPVPILMLARDSAAAATVRNAVLDHRVYTLGPDQFEAIRSFWVNEVRDPKTGPLTCGDILEHGSFEIAARSMNGALGFDYILPPRPSAEHLQRFEKFLEDRKINDELAANLKEMLASL